MLEETLRKACILKFVADEFSFVFSPNFHRIEITEYVFYSNVFRRKSQRLANHVARPE